MLKRLLALLVFIPFFLVASAGAAQTFSGLQADQPVEVTSARLEVFQAERKTVFSGDVVATQGDFVLNAKKLTVFFNADQSQVERMEAVGQVKITQQGRIATADKAIFKQPEQVLELQGNAQLQQGENRIVGDEITVYLKENRSVVKSSGSGRVKALIIPAKKQDGAR